MGFGWKCRSFKLIERGAFKNKEWWKRWHVGTRRQEGKDIYKMKPEPEHLQKCYSRQLSLGSIPRAW